MKYEIPQHIITSDELNPEELKTRADTFLNDMHRFSKLASSSGVLSQGSLSLPYVVYVPEFNAFKVDLNDFVSPFYIMIGVLRNKSGMVGIRLYDYMLNIAEDYSLDSVIDAINRHAIRVLNLDVILCDGNPELICTMNDFSDYTQLSANGEPLNLHRPLTYIGAFYNALFVDYKGRIVCVDYFYYGYDNRIYIDGFKSSTIMMLLEVGVSNWVLSWRLASSQGKRPSENLLKHVADGVYSGEYGMVKFSTGATRWQSDLESVLHFPTALDTSGKTTIGVQLASMKYFTRFSTSASQYLIPTSRILPSKPILAFQNECDATHGLPYYFSNHDLDNAVHGLSDRWAMMETADIWKVYDKALLGEFISRNYYDADYYDENMRHEWGISVVDNSKSIQGAFISVLPSSVIHDIGIGLRDVAIDPLALSMDWAISDGIPLIPAAVKQDLQDWQLRVVTSRDTDNPFVFRVLRGTNGSRYKDYNPFLPFYAKNIKDTSSPYVGVDNSLRFYIVNIEGEDAHMSDVLTLTGSCFNLAVLRDATVLENEVSDYEDNYYLQLYRAKRFVFDKVIFNSTVASPMVSCYSALRVKHLEIGGETEVVPAMLCMDLNHDNYVHLESVSFGDKVERIGYKAFYQETLKSVTFPKSLKYIEGSSFAKCELLEEIDIPEGTIEIGADAFSGCTSLKSVKIPSTVTHIHRNAFRNCSSLTSLHISGNPYVESSAFEGCLAQIKAQVGIYRKFSSSSLGTGRTFSLRFDD